MRTAAQARAAGLTREIEASGPFHDLNLLVAPEADLDGTFAAYDLDNCEPLSVNGWLFIIEDAA